MERLISVFSRELCDGGGGTPSRLTLNDAQIAEQLEHALRSYAAWSPICWKNDARSKRNFERASVVAVDWEVTHTASFPVHLYRDANRFVEFINSLRQGDSPLPDFAHTTCHGVRLIWLCDREIADSAEYQELVSRVCLDFGGDIKATGLSTGFAAARHLQGGVFTKVANDVEG